MKMKRNLRAIDLTDDPVIPADGDFYKEEHTTFENSNRTVVFSRTGDVLTITKTVVDHRNECGRKYNFESKSVVTRSPYIDWDEILDHTKVEADEYYNETPWANDEGYSHVAVDLDKWMDDRELPFNMRDQLRRARACVYSQSDREYVMLQIEDDGNKQAHFEYMRKQGASKQVAAELAACWQREYVNQLVEWYKNGWVWYMVAVDFEIEGEEYTESCGGILEEDYAKDEMQPELVGNVAHCLEKRGFIVTNKPKRVAQWKQKRIRENRNMFNWRY